MLPHVTAATRGLPGKPGAAPTSSTAHPTKGLVASHHFTPSRTPDPGTLDLRKAERAGRQTADVGHPYPSPRREHTSRASPRGGRQPPPQRSRHQQKGLEPLGGPCCTAHRGPQGPPWTGSSCKQRCSPTTPTEACLLGRARRLDDTHRPLKSQLPGPPGTPRNLRASGCQREWAPA